VVTGHVVPLDAVGVEIVEDGEAGLFMWRLLSSSSVVRLGEAGTSSVGPVEAVGEPDGVGGGVGPTHQLVGVVHDPSSPEEPLSVLSNQPVELILLGGSVQRDGLHPHGVAVGLGLVLLEGGAADLPGDDEAFPVPEVVWSSRRTLVSSASDTVLGRLEGRRLWLSHLLLLWLLWPWLEYWGLLDLLEVSLGGSRLELLLLWLLRLGLEELLLLLLLELLLLKLLWWSPLWLWSII